MHSRLLPTVHLSHTGSKIRKFSPSTAYRHPNAAKRRSTSTPAGPIAQSSYSSIPTPLNTPSTLPIGPPPPGGRDGTGRKGRAGPTCKHIGPKINTSGRDVSRHPIVQTLDPSPQRPSPLPGVGWGPTPLHPGTKFIQHTTTSSNYFSANKNSIKPFLSTRSPTLAIKANLLQNFSLLHKAKWLSG